MDKILVAFAHDVCSQLGSRLSSLFIEVYFAHTRAELTSLLKDGSVFQVAVLPATLSNSQTTWWELFGELAVLKTKPEILVCAPTADFQFWSGVLDAGGYDVLTEPFSLEELQSAVLHALESFKRRANLNEVA